MQRLFVLMIIFVINLILLVNLVHASEVETRVIPPRMLIGEHAELIFEIDILEGNRLEMPIFNEMINDKIEILQYGTTDTLPSEKPGHIRLRRKLLITSWEDGFHPIEPFRFLHIIAADTLILESDPVLLEVEAFDLEEQTDLKDIKSLISAPITVREVLPWSMVALALAGLVYGILSFMKKRKVRPQPQTIWEKPDIPAHVAAFNSLEKLKARKLWQQGKIKEYYSEITEVLRHYLEKRYGINAMEMTTSEIMHAMVGKFSDLQAREILLSRLQLADLVKFARYTPNVADNEHIMEDSFVFVKMTMAIAEEDKS